MTIGLSTYAFFWRASAKVVAPLSLHDMLKQTHELGCTVLQICDYPAIESYDAECNRAEDVEEEGQSPSELYEAYGQLLQILKSRLS